MAEKDDKNKRSTVQGERKKNKYALPQQHESARGVSVSGTELGVGNMRPPAGGLNLAPTNPGPPLAGGLLGGVAPFDPLAPLARSVGAPVAAEGSPLAKALGGFAPPAPAAVEQPADRLAELRSLAASLFPDTSVDVGAVLRPFDEAASTARQTADASRGAIGEIGQSLLNRLGELQGQAATNNDQINAQISGDLAGLLARHQAQNDPLINDLAKQGASPQSQQIAARAGVLREGLEGQSALQQSLANRLAQSAQNENTSRLSSAEQMQSGALGTLQTNLDAILGQIGLRRADAETQANAANRQAAADRARGLFGLAGDLVGLEAEQAKAGAGASAIAPYVGRTDPFASKVNTAIEAIEAGTITPEEAKAAINQDAAFKEQGYSPAEVNKIIDDYVKEKSALATATPDLMGIFRALLGQ